ncbi:hypothetical protein F5B22DRAFT_353350 [Xylaria bambusicola]|uniref:uncharacterized protein n=1 Tax=Xylaria bambusicola TaxID=326684 RepID=UPI002007C22F|nr:uncharacterized protein F5B22DRAFT_353350 [Xylaria bambusicola]KAI0525635.1 hypothetical protein F5B22DRAFT_353350 [Xylaria bambusicola]
MGLPTAIVANMTSEQLEAYTLHLRIEEISQKLRIDDVVPADGDRSPSPPPQYDNHGRRVNTREYRYRKRLEDERHKLIEKAMKTIPNYHPPQDYRRPTKTQEKVYVPVNDYPEINFIGLLIGPRGNTLKKRKYDCPEKQNFTANIICRVCGNAGHMARDCPDRQKGASWRNDGPRAAGRIGGADGVDREYEQLMQELGGGSSGPPARIEAGPGSYNNNNGNGDSKPWQRGPTGAAAPWRTRNDDRGHEGGGGGSGGGPAPWRDRGNRGGENQGGDYYGGQNYGNGPSAPGAAPWHQPNQGNGQSGYNSYPGYAGYGSAAPGMGPPPGLPANPLGAPPGLPGNLNALIQQYAGGAVPPPPPSDGAPPPPPSDQPPPPPPGA